MIVSHLPFRFKLKQGSLSEFLPPPSLSFAVFAIGSECRAPAEALTPREAVFVCCLRRLQGDIALTEHPGLRRLKLALCLPFSTSQREFAAFFWCVVELAIFHWAIILTVNNYRAVDTSFLRSLLGLYMYMIASMNSLTAEPLCEMDIVDECDEFSFCEISRPLDMDDIPSRPVTRLGFNEDDDDEGSFVRPGSSLNKWTRSLFQKIGIGSLSSQPHETSPLRASRSAQSCEESDDFDMDIIAASQEHAESLCSSSSSSLELEDINLDDDDAIPDDVSEPSSDETDLSECLDPRFVIRALPPLLTPLVEDTFRKYTCPPSPLAAGPSIQTMDTPQHLQPDHGHSRHSFSHIKWFWMMRRVNWEEFVFERAYGGISLPEPCPPWHHSPQNADSTEPPLPPLSIHPRRGDLTTLRDPYCAHIDRCFVQLPLWTISKTLFMFDVHTACQSLEQHFQQDSSSSELSEGDDTSFDDSASLISVPTSSTDLGGDSDTTLVDSDAEDDTWQGPLRQAGTVVKPLQDCLSLHSASTSNAESSSPTSEQSAFQIWETDFYRRWEILMELMRHNQQSSPEINVASPTPTSSHIAVFPGKRPRFFVGAGEDDDEA
ncbi:hypothetical protein FISHEDRAFT_74726 [Fistulina hepatica ATCC 64428]|uniref:Uncharacterized protein n=1 Tax=Fistulina hepatica ATCC 64428 TaxID=1128425 RepID=A0A0D7A8V2_9AGAR|nr:hypothetical protein FISHEDRAFT_74726 [Fistulina hepatica ATCC 64428]